MRRLRSRVERLARRQTAVPCPACAAHGVVRFYEVHEGEPEPEPLGPCPACGKVPEGINQIIVMIPRNGRECDRRAS